MLPTRYLGWAAHQHVCWHVAENRSMPTHSKQSKTQDNKARTMTDKNGLVRGLCYFPTVSALENILSGELRVSFYTPAFPPAPAHLRAGRNERTLHRSSQSLSVSYCQLVRVCTSCLMLVLSLSAMPDYTGLNAFLLDWLPSFSLRQQKACMCTHGESWGSLCAACTTDTAGITGWQEPWPQPSELGITLSPLSWGMLLQSSSVCVCRDHRWGSVCCTIWEQPVENLYADTSELYIFFLRQRSQLPVQPFLWSGSSSRCGSYSGWCTGSPDRLLFSPWQWIHT